MIESQKRLAAPPVRFPRRPAGTWATGSDRPDATSRLDAGWWPADLVLPFRDAARRRLEPARRDRLGFAARSTQAASRFESAAEKLGLDCPSFAELRQLCRQVEEITAELFPGLVGVEVRADPEIAEDLYFVFEVHAAGRVDEIVERDAEWHRRLVGVARRWPGMFRLSVDAR